jgi:hypothetical protein
VNQSKSGCLAALPWKLGLEARKRDEKCSESVLGKAGAGRRTPIQEMLVKGEKFRMGGAGVGGSCGDGDGGVDVEGDRRETDLVAAGLVAQF